MSDKIKVILGGSEGNMGKTLQRLIDESDDMEVFGKIDPRGVPSYRDARHFLDLYFKEDVLPEGLVYVDFTTPQTVVDNVRMMSGHCVDSVIGTTGWFDRLPEMEEIVGLYDSIILYPKGNFSIGANAYTWVTERLTEILGPYGFDSALLELHHKGKKDAPSGTAIMAAQGLLKLPGKDTLTHVRYGKDAKRGDNEIDVVAARVGSVTGWHMTVYSPNSSDYERLTIEHNASNREVFGRPCLDAVRWVYNSRKEGREPGLYEFSRDVLKLV